VFERLTIESEPPQHYCHECAESVPAVITALQLAYDQELLIILHDEQVTDEICAYCQRPVATVLAPAGLYQAEVTLTIQFGRQGRFHDRGYEAQLNRASALSLVINAIAVWNTRYFEQAQTALAKQGVPVPEEVWQHLSPLQWAHIHLNGSYHFTNLALGGDFRPLREYHGPRARIAPCLRSAETEAVTLLEDEEVIPVQLSLLAEEEKDQ
jgi:hypothetical protein